jgi:glycosyltransferase involved in cell wall biosynthesis
MAHLLFLSAWCPLPADNGVKLRISHLLRELACHHEVDLLTFAPELPDAAALYELRALCASVELVPETPFAGRAGGRLHGLLSVRPRSIVANHSATMAKAVRACGGRRYDLVIASELHMAPYALLLRGVPRLLEGIELATLNDQHASQSRLLGRLRYGLTWWKTRRYVVALLRQFAGATVVSERELALLRPLAPARARLAVVPNGVDTAACEGSFGDPEADMLIYPGALSYDANFDAVAHFLGSIWPRLRAARPGVRLRVTGRATPEQIAALPAAEGVEFTGYLDDVRPAVARAWAEVVPLRKGSGTRLKVLEALALGTPVVSTSKGVEGLDVEDGRHILVADTAEAFAATTARLLTQPDLRARLVAAGRQLVRERYDWRIVGERLNDLVAETALQPGQSYVYSAN